MDNVQQNEREQLLKELNILTDKQDAIAAMIDARKARLQAMLNEAGDRGHTSAYFGSVGFSPRRSFEVVDRAKLGKKLKKEHLVTGFKPTAALVDALAQAGINITGIISIGVSENFQYTRPMTKEAKERRARIIQESQATYEKKVAEIAQALAG